MNCCCEQESKIWYVNIHSDFKINEIGFDPSLSFRFTYYSGGKKFEASHINGVYENCYIDTDNTLIVVFDNHGLDAGRLFVEREISYPDVTFEDGSDNNTNYQLLFVILTNEDAEDVGIIVNDISDKEKDIYSLLSLEMVKREQGDLQLKDLFSKIDQKVNQSLEILSRNNPLINLNAFYNATYTGIDGALKILKSYNTLYQNVFGRGIIKNGLIITYRTTAVDWETMRYTGDDLEDVNVWDANKWTDLNRVLNNAVKRLSDDVFFINLNNYQFAKYGSLTTAIDGLLLLDSIYNTMYGRRLVKRGLIMTYLVGGDEWATKRFVGSDDESDYVDDELIRFEPYWKDFAGGGDLSGLSQEIADRKAADKELEELVSLEGSARETAVRDLSMSVSKLWDNLTFFNVNKTDDSNYTLEAAILQTLTVSKLYQMYYGKPLLCQGLVITYRNDLKIWENKRYIGKAFDDDTVKDEANWINFAAGGTVENKNFVSVMPSGNLINIDYRRTPYAMVTLSGVDAIHNLSISNTSEGDSGQIMVFQTGFKQIAAAENITGTIDLPLMDGTIALLTYNRVGKNIYIHTDIIVGDVQYPRPQKIADFDVIYSDSSSCTVQWTAPWANNLYDKATEYDMRYSNSVVDADDPKVWAGLKKVKNVPPPEDPGVQQKMTITGLTPGKEYYVYLKGLKVNYGVQYASLASDFVYFRTLGSEDTEKAYRINLDNTHIITQNELDCSGMTDEQENNVYLDDGYIDTTSKNYQTAYSTSKFSRSKMPYDIFIDLYGLHTMDRIYCFMKKGSLSVYTLKDIGYKWEKAGEISSYWNDFVNLSLQGKTARFLKLSFDLWLIGGRSYPNEAEGYEGPLKFDEFNDSITDIYNIVLYARPQTTRPEGICEPQRNSTSMRSADEFFCTNGQLYHQGRIQSMCSGRNVRLFISQGWFVPVNGDGTSVWADISTSDFGVDECGWVSGNNGTGQELEGHLRDTYKRYGLKPFLTFKDGTLKPCVYNTTDKHWRPLDSYWLPGAPWRPIPIKGVGGLERYFSHTYNPNEYKTVSRLLYALSAKYGSNPAISDRSMIRNDSGTGFGLDLISGIEWDNEPDGAWEGFHHFSRPEEVAAIASASVDGNGGTMTDEKGNNCFGIKTADPNLLAIHPGYSAVVPGTWESEFIHFNAIRPKGGFPVDVINVHQYFSNTGNQNSGSTDAVQYAVPLDYEIEVNGNTSRGFQDLVKLRNRLASNKEIWLTEFGYGEAGGRGSQSALQCFSAPGRYIGDWLIPDRHRADVKGAYTIRAAMYLMFLGFNQVNYYSTECEADFFDDGKWGTGPGLEMFHWNDCTDTTPGAKYDAIEKFEHSYARGSFSAMGLFGNILANGGYPISRAYWYVATFRNRLKGYVYTGRKYLDDTKIMVFCFKKTGEDKGCYVVWYNDRINTGSANVDIPLPEGVKKVTNVTVYVPDIQNPQAVPSGLGNDESRTGLPAARHERHENGKWVVKTRGDYAKGAAVYPSNPEEGMEVVVMPTMVENPYFPIVGPVKSAYSSNGNKLEARQHEKFNTSTGMYEVAYNIYNAWKQVEACCDYIDYTEEGMHGTRGDEKLMDIVRNTLTCNVSEFPEYYFFDAVPEPDYKSEVTDFNARPVSGEAVELWWNNTNAEDTAYQIFVSSLPETGYTLLKEISAGIENKASIAGLKPKTVYYYKLRPVKGTLMGTLSDYTSVRTYSVLPAPSDLKVTERTATSISIEWGYTDEQLADFVYYAVYRGDNSGAFVQIGKIEDKTVRSFRDTGLVVGRTYRYKVRAVGLNGQSDYTPEIETRTLLPEECPPELIQAVTDKLGTKIILTYDLPVGEIADNAADNFTLTENDNLRLVKYVSNDAANANNLVIGIAPDSLSDYDKQSDIRLSYTGEGVQSAYGIELTGFDRVRVGNIIGNFTNLEAEFKLNFCDGSNPIPTDITWNNLAGNPQTGISIQLTDTYGRQSSVVATSVHTPKNYEWGGTSDSGACKIQGIEEAVYKYGWKVQYGSTQDESKVARLKLSGLNNEHRYTISIYGGSSYGGEKTARIKVGERYSATVQQLGNETTMMTLEDCTPVDGVIYVDLINMIKETSASYPTMQFMFVEEFRSGSEPENKDVWLREATVLEDTGDGVVKFPDVTIRLNCIGIATAYRVSETEDMTGAGWTDITDDSLDVPYVLSDGYGAKALYVQVKNLYSESNVRVINLDYMDPYVPLVLKNIYINKDDSVTYDRNVKIFVEKDGVPTHYKISESSEMEGTEWQLWTDPKVSEIAYGLSGEQGIKTVYMQIKDGVTVSTVKADTIQFKILTKVTGTVSIPLPKDVTSAQDVNISIAPLKYNKRFAFSYSVDDSSMQTYSVVHALYAGKWIDDDNFCHLGGKRTTGYTPEHPLYYTDGFGTRRYFAGSNYLITLRTKEQYSKYPLEGSSGSSNPYLMFDELKILQDFDWDWMIHNVDEGVWGKGNPENIVKGMIEVNDYMESHGVGRSPLSSHPDGNNSYYTAALMYDEIRAYLKGGVRDVNLMTGEEKMNLPRYFMTNLTTDNLHKKFSEIENGSILGVSALWNTFGGHRPRGNVGVNDGDWNTIKELVEYIHATYGGGGSDEIWFPNDNEVYQYLYLKKYTQITKQIIGGNLVITIEMPAFDNFKWFETTLLLDIQAETASCDDNVYGLTCGMNNGHFMININMMHSLVERSEKYTAKFEASENVEDMDDALYFVQRLKESLRAPYLARINAVRSAPVLTVFVINGGETTEVAGVTCNLTYTGKATHYMLSEDAGFATGEWTPFVNNDVPFTLKNTEGLHTVYCKVKNQFGESGVISDTVTYTPPALSLTSVVINSGAAKTETAEVSVGITYTGIPTHYRIGETADLSAAPWTGIADGISYTFGDTRYGTKTIYVQLKDTKGVSDILSDNIELVEPEPVKIIISFGSEELDLYNVMDGKTINYTRFFNSSNNIKMLSIRDTKGNEACMLCRGSADYDGVKGVDYADTKQMSNPSVDDSGVYPAMYIQRHFLNFQSSSGLKAIIRFKQLEPGTYTVRVLPSCGASSDIPASKFSNVFYAANGIEKNISFNPLNNMTEFVEIDNVPVTDTGVLDIQFWNTYSGYYRPGFNLIEIIKK